MVLEGRKCYVYYSTYGILVNCGIVLPLCMATKNCFDYYILSDMADFKNYILNLVIFFNLTS